MPKINSVMILSLLLAFFNFLFLIIWKNIKKSIHTFFIPSYIKINNSRFPGIIKIILIFILIIIFIFIVMAPGTFVGIILLITFYELLLKIWLFLIKKRADWNLFFLII